MFRKKDTRFITRAAVIAAIYCALTLLLRPISYGEVQLRVSEALTILPVLTPAAVPGLFIGCLLANLLGGSTVIDIVFGSLATLGAAQSACSGGARAGAVQRRDHRAGAERPVRYAAAADHALDRPGRGGRLLRAGTAAVVYAQKGKARYEAVRGLTIIEKKTL